MSSRCRLLQSSGRGIPKQYGGSPNGISFSYPGNWELSDNGPSGIVVRSPNTAYLIITHAEKAVDNATLQEIVDSTMEGQKEGARETGVSIEGIQTKQIPSLVKASKAKGVEQNFSIVDGGESRPHIEQYHRVEGPKHVAFLISMDKLEESEGSKPGFQLIYDTFKVSK